MRILQRRPTSIFALLEKSQTFVCVFRGRNRTADVETLEETLLESAKVCRGPMRVITIIESGATIGDRGRKRLAVMFTSVAVHVIAWATVIEGSGFWASTARAIAAGVRLFSRTAFPLKIFSSLGDANSYLASSSPLPFEPTFAEDLAALRARLTPSSD